MLPRLLAITLVAGPFFLPGVALATSNGGPASLQQGLPDTLQAGRKSVHWRCWYNQEVHIHCLLDEAPATAQAPQNLISGKLPAIAREIYAKPESFRNALVSVPLLAPPMDMQLVAVLADAVVCGARQDCSVKFTEELPTRTEVHTILGKYQAIIRAAPAWPADPEPSSREAAASPTYALAKVLFGLP